MVVGITSPIIVLLILSKNISLPQSGVIMAALSVAVVVFELPSGIISDRIGRKQTYLISQMLFLGSFLILVFAKDFLSVLSSFLLFGTARAFASGSIESDFIETFLKKHGVEKLHTLITGMNLGETLGLAVGALLGGVLPEITRRLLPGSNEFFLNIALQIGITLVLIAMTLAFHRTQSERNHAPILVFLRDAYESIHGSRILKLLLVGVFIWGLVFSSIELYWQPRLKELVIDKNSTVIFGYLNSAYFAFAAVGALAVNTILSHFKINSLILIFLLRILLGTVLIALAVQGGVLFFSILYLFLMGVNGMLNVPEGTVLNAHIPEDKRSSLLSFSSLVMQTGGIIASLAFSLAVTRLGVRNIWIICGALFALSSLIYLKGPSKTKTGPLD